MKNGKMPNPNTIHPIDGYDKEIYVKPTIKSKNKCIERISCRQHHLSKDFCIRA